MPHLPILKTMQTLHAAPPAVLLLVGLSFAGSSLLGILLANARRKPTSAGSPVAAWVLLAFPGLAGAYGAFLAARGFAVPSLFEMGVVTFALCAATASDLARGDVPGWSTTTGILGVLVATYSEGRFVSTLIAAIVVVVPFAAVAAFSRGRQLGWGDVGIVAVGAVLLDQQTALLLFAVCTLAAPAVAVLRRRGKEPVLIAPYLAAAILLGELLPAASGIRAI